MGSLIPPEGTTRALARHMADRTGGFSGRSQTSHERHLSREQLRPRSEHSVTARRTVVGSVLAGPFGLGVQPAQRPRPAGQELPDRDHPDDHRLLAGAPARVRDVETDDAQRADLLGLTSHHERGSDDPRPDVEQAAYSGAPHPEVFPAYLAYALYVFELDIRASLALGLVGAGGISRVCRRPWPVAGCSGSRSMSAPRRCSV